jgi:hypothetical protein
MQAVVLVVLVGLAPQVVIPVILELHPLSKDQVVLELTVQAP